jgi:hypothetical protein
MTTKILAAFGVRGKLPPEVDKVLALANEYRDKLVSLNHERHCRMIDLRNDYIDGLYDAMVAMEFTNAKIAEVEKRIKAHHSDVRDRNSVLWPDGEELVDLRALRVRQLVIVKSLRLKWYATERAFKLLWNSVTEWKNVKTLANRKELYDSIVFPESADEYSALAQDDKPLDASLLQVAAIKEFGLLWMGFDLRQRELSQEYQSRGLHSAVRGEIVNASKPAKSMTSPGIMYRYGRPPKPQPWELITQQIVGGATWDTILKGTPQLSARHVGGTLYEIKQQIGTASHPRLVAYHVNVDKQFPSDCRVNRWSLVVRHEKQLVHNKAGYIGERLWQRATVNPTIVYGTAPSSGSGPVLRYRLSWTRLTEGVKVAHFWSDIINEPIVLPWELVKRRMNLKDVQQASDKAANNLLSFRGINPQPNCRQGFDALVVYCEDNPDDPEALNLMDLCVHANGVARRVAQRATRTIAKIYETVAHRLSETHGSIVHDNLPLAKLKKYDARDLLKSDPLPYGSREVLFAVAPGRFREKLKQCGLIASGESMGESPEAARETMELTTYVLNASRGTGRRRSRNRDRSQNGAASQ